MKKIFLFIAISICSFAQAQYDTLVSISSYNGFARKAAPGSYNWSLDNKQMTLNVAVLTYDTSDNVINNLQIHPYSVTISTDGICVNPSTGMETPCSVSGSIPQYVFLRALSLKPVSIMSELLQYIQIADSNGAFN
jgi:hypothetical protein